MKIYLNILLMLSISFALNTFANVEITTISPSARIINAPINSSISVTFDQPIDQNSISSSSFSAFGKWSGFIAGTYDFSKDNQTVTLIPDRRFSAGENIMVILSHDIKSVDGEFLRSSGYSWQFWVKSRNTTLDFNRTSVMTTNSQGQSSRPYGGIATDLNHDGYLDLTVINEDTSDLRIYMNKADGSGTFNPFNQPTTSVGDRASPSEPSDFNQDGHVDIAVVNINDNNISVLLGNGDGSFAPAQNINVGSMPRGIAVLDVDGDGDTDIVNTNFNSDNMSLLINNGNGIFSNAVFFDITIGKEWALASADMDEDGLLDLIVANQDVQTINVLRNNGNATFTNIESIPSGGVSWMLVIGDVNNDGHEDVAVVNSNSNNGATLFGDGHGQLHLPVTISTDQFPLASDLGDIDGDGDLDWVTSSFSGDWQLFTNNGSGQFTFNQEFDAPIAASCALLMDSDNDMDLDLVLIDELADVVYTYNNLGNIPNLIFKNGFE